MIVIICYMLATVYFFGIFFAVVGFFCGHPIQAIRGGNFAGCWLEIKRSVLIGLCIGLVAGVAWGGSLLYSESAYYSYSVNLYNALTDWLPWNIQRLIPGGYNIPWDYKDIDAYTLLLYVSSLAATCGLYKLFAWLYGQRKTLWPTDD